MTVLILYVLDTKLLPKLPKLALLLKTSKLEILLDLDGKEMPVTLVTTVLLDLLTPVPMELLINLTPISEDTLLTPKFLKNYYVKSPMVWT